MATVAPPSAQARTHPPDAGPPRVAGWHHNLETVDLVALEELYATLEWLGESDYVAILVEKVDPRPFGFEPRDAWRRAIAAARVTVYRELLVRGGCAIFAGDNLGAVTIAEVNARLTERCENPVCSADHDRDGRHRKAAHL